MNKPVIPVIDVRQRPAPTSQELLETIKNIDLSKPTLDTLGRPLRDLRISVTDRCNFRCSYCMPKSVFDRDYAYLPQKELLRFEEITTIAAAATQLGVKKIRITGGEPLLRKNVEILIAQLSELRTLDGKPLDLTLTTNASLLKKKAQSLKDAGLKRLTISLDAMDDAIFRQMNDMDFPVADVLDGIAMASQVGFEDIKVNMVVKRGTNEDQILPMAAHFRGTGVSLRFIEYMDVGASNGWRMDEVLPTADVLSLLQSRWPLQALPPKSVGETATRYGYLNAQGALDPQLGEVGFISSVTQAFCQDCNRARLSTDGRLFNCLFATEGANVRDLLRGAPDGGVDTVAQYLAYLWQQRTDQYSALRQAGMVPAGNAERRVEMSFIGG
ncbi:MAG: GTP 3',8-cyclase MoaA [Burkholderiaceae bacterium]|jgi:cyclic pyranopterin phosphate synthase|nr:GTP 3',8-cyclase MoaA [Betaproteobacteria bacterium]MDA9075356.1 GTP 3',8-cyclase MoaA [Burkholderiaceae bacterium]MDA9884889.1 GTP 3',8-cyclase MoaA [Burkholderiaceae bacterium]MDP4697617.1 GTP 3',8-cyclase MoaA [Burkholderiaceae bacterium]MDP4842184.1 GTP 3',8-cyclase MoaA [Burkholderiaceae bacterium]